MKETSDASTDIERDAIDETHLTNTNVHSLAWQNVQVETDCRKSDLRSKFILSQINGIAKAGAKSRFHNGRYCIDVHQGNLWPSWAPQEVVRRRC